MDTQLTPEEVEQLENLFEYLAGDPKAAETFVENRHQFLRQYEGLTQKCKILLCSDVSMVNFHFVAKEPKPNVVRFEGESVKIKSTEIGAEHPDGSPFVNTVVLNSEKEGTVDFSNEPPSVSLEFHTLETFQNVPEPLNDLGVTCSLVHMMCVGSSLLLKRYSTNDGSEVIVIGPEMPVTWYQSGEEGEGGKALSLTGFIHSDGRMSLKLRENPGDF
jgi:hypothetical protein